MPNSTESATGVLAAGQEPGQAASPNGNNGAAPTLEQQLADAERKGADRARSEMTASYRGIQRTLSQRDAEITQLRQQANVLGLIPVLQKQVNTLISKTLGPEEARQYQQEQEINELKALVTAGQAQNQMSRPEAPAPYVDEQSARTEVLNTWFPESTLSPDDRRIDWAQDAHSAQEAQTRFRRSVLKAEREDAAKGARDEAQNQVQGVRQTAEERLRAAGVDNVDRSRPAGPANFTNNALTSQVPTEWNPRELLKMGFESNEAQMRKDLKAAAKARQSA